MSGWSRLAIFLATLIAVPVFVAIFSDASSAYNSTVLTVDVEHLSGQRLNDAVLAEMKREDSDRAERWDHCDAADLKITSAQSDYDPGRYYITCDLSKVWACGRALEYSAIPWAIVWSIVMGIGWVVGGFQRPQT